jgi:hypothetical protein
MDSLGRVAALCFELSLSARVIALYHCHDDHAAVLAGGTDGVGRCGFGV